MYDLFTALTTGEVTQFVYEGKIYEIHEVKTGFESGKAFCEGHGGALAKITQQIVTEDFYAPFSQFLSHRIGVNCAWIGVSDLQYTGRWQWTDGRQWVCSVFPQVKRKKIITCYTLL